MVDRSIVLFFAYLVFDNLVVHLSLSLSAVQYFRVVFYLLSNIFHKVRISVVVMIMINALRSK